MVINVVMYHYVRNNEDYSYDTFCRRTEEFEAQVEFFLNTSSVVDPNDIEKIKKHCETNNSTFLFSPNFSLGVNLFFKINNSVSKIMRNSDEFDLRISEVHHTSKIDSPSGTALKIKKDIDSILNKDVQIESKRIGSNN